MEVDFPRGGKRPKSKPTDPEAAKKRKLENGEAKKAEKKNAEDASGEKSIENDVFKKFVKAEMLTVGVRGLGSVYKINDDSIVLKAINNITVNVPAQYLSEVYKKALVSSSSVATLDEIFKIGQLVAFKVEKAGDKRTPPVASVCPTRVNSCVTTSTLFNGLVLNAAVKSIEEKGAVLDLGIGSVSGFAATEALPDLKSLHVGQILLVRVIRESGDLKRFVKVSAFPEMDTLEEEKLVLNHLMPGTVLHAEPTLKVENGFVVTFKNGLKAFVHTECLPPRLRADLDRLVKSFRVVVAVCSQNSPILVVTGHPDIVALSKAERRIAPAGFGTGETIEGDVYTVDRRSNVYLTVPESGDKVSLVTAKLTGKNRSNDKTRKYTPGTSHKLVIITYSPFDRHVLVTDNKDALKSGASVNTDLVPGQRITATVKSVVDAGLLVTIGMHTNGNIPAEHVFDIPIAAWKNAFTVGQKIKCRVLNKAPNRNNYFLTAKPSLVNMTEEPVTEYDPSLVGKIVVGFCTRILERGAVVRFFNNVKALLPDHEAAKIPALKVGTPIKGVVVKVDPELQHMGIFVGERGARKQKAKPADAPKKTTKAPKPTNICKALQIYPAKIVGEWTYGTSGVAIEVSLPGDNIGRLHACELGLGDSQISPDASVIEAFLKKHKNEYLNVRVIERSRPSKRHGKAVMEALKKRKITKLYEVTLVPEKLSAPKMRKKLIDYPTVQVGSDVVVYFTNFSQKFQRGEVSPFARVMLLPESSNFALNDVANEIGLQEAVPIPLKVGSSQLCKLVSKNGVTKTSTVALKSHEPVVPAKNATAVGRVISVARHPFAAKVSFGNKVFGSIPASGFSNSNLAAHELAEQLSTDGLYNFKFISEAEDQWILTSSTKKKHPGTWTKGKSYTGYVVEVPSDDTAVVEVYPGVTATLTTESKLSLDDFVTFSCTKALKSGTPEFTVVLVTPAVYTTKEKEHENDETDDESETEEESEAEESEAEEEEVDDIEMLGASDDETEKSVVQKAIESLASNAGLWSSNALSEDKLVAAKEQLGINKKQAKATAAAARAAAAEAKANAEKKDEDPADSGLEDVSEEARILHKEKLLAGIEKTVGIPSDIEFDRLVLSNPNSAETWIQYMVHQAESGDIDSARNVAETALKTINIREDAERLNMMTAYLSLEASSGTEETLKAVFNRALGAFDKLEVYKRLANIYSVSKNNEELEKLYSIMLKKFGPFDRDVWTLYGTFLYKNGQQNTGRNVMKRALNSLEKRYHLEVLSRFANLEYTYGDIERGKTMFEKALAAAPKRGDLWNVYIDKAIKYQTPDDVRGIFDRALSNKMGYNTIKNLFQKWQDFEALRGDEAHAKMVTERAIEYADKVKKEVKADVK
uniref:S1 motif domain-containing protein n=1 Tax=Panagrellus redivivus TaxID=6233 RepID=A0A7E4UPB4_PANRE